MLPTNSVASGEARSSSNGRLPRLLPGGAARPSALPRKRTSVRRDAHPPCAAEKKKPPASALHAPVRLEPSFTPQLSRRHSDRGALRLLQAATRRALTHSRPITGSDGLATTDGGRYNRRGSQYRARTKVCGHARLRTRQGWTTPPACTSREQLQPRTQHDPLKARRKERRKAANLNPPVPHFANRF